MTKPIPVPAVDAVPAPSVPSVANEVLEMLDGVFADTTTGQTRK